MGTGICGVAKRLRDSTDESLLSLRDQLGRNGETSRSEKIRKKIDQILANRKKVGPEISEEDAVFNAS